MPWRSEICNEQVRFKNGRMFIPDAPPSLCIDLNEEAIAAQPYEAHDLHHCNGPLTAVRPPDANGCFKK